MGKSPFLTSMSQNHLKIIALLIFFISPSYFTPSTSGFLTNFNSDKKIISKNNFKLKNDNATTIITNTNSGDNTEKKFNGIYSIIGSLDTIDINQSLIDNLVYNNYSKLELINMPNCLINNVSFNILLSISNSPNCVITNNTFKFDSLVLYDYIINLDNSSNSIFNGNYFYNTTGKIGIKIINSTSINVSGNKFFDTRINTNIYLEGASNSIINENLIDNNDGPYFSYCMEVFSSDNVSVRDNTIKNIKFEDLHGTSLGVYFFKANGTVINNTIINLFARLHGSYGVYVRRVPSLLIQSNNVSETFKWVYIDLTPKNGIITCSENIWENKIRKGCSLKELNTNGFEFFPGISLDFISLIIISLGMIFIIVAIYFIRRFLK